MNTVQASILCAGLLVSATVGMTAEETTTFVEPMKRFSVNHPVSWNVVTDKLGLTVISKGSSEDATQPNIKILLAPLIGGTLDGYVSNAMKLYNRVWKISKSEEITVSGVRARVVVAEQKTGSQTLMIVKCFLASTGHIFVITGTAAPAEFERYRSIFDQAIFSFKPFPERKSQSARRQGF